MKEGLLLLLVSAFLSPAGASAEKYSYKEEGDFAPAGHRVEFYDRYGWRSYEVKFTFGFDASARQLTRESKLELKVKRRKGGSWSHACRNKGRESIYANVNYLFGKGISIVAECRIPPEDFAEAVGLGEEDVGQPHLVFHVLIEEGKVRPGAQRGVYFAPGGQIESSELAAYAAEHDDPTSLAVVFREKKR